jgi:hypothetical protein
MTIDMDTTALTAVAQLAALINATEALGKRALKRQDGIESLYPRIAKMLRRFNYPKLNQKEKGVVRKYLITCSGYAESHADHLIARWRREHCRLTRRLNKCIPRSTLNSWPMLCSPIAIQNGRALKEVCHDMCQKYGDVRFKRFANISASRLYDLKKTGLFQGKTGTYTKT